MCYNIAMDKDARENRIAGRLDAVRCLLKGLADKQGDAEAVAKLAAAMDGELVGLSDDFTEYQREFDLMRAKLTLGCHRQFGRKSEAANGQMMLEQVFNEAEAASDETPQPQPQPPEPDPGPEEVAGPAGARKPRAKRYPGQKAGMLKDLPVVQVDHELPEGDRKCGRCGKPLRELAPDVSYRLHIEPPKVTVLKNVQHTYVSCDCQTGGCGCGHGCGEGAGEGGAQQGGGGEPRQGGNGVQDGGGEPREGGNGAQGGGDAGAGAQRAEAGAQEGAQEAVGRGAKQAGAAGDGGGDGRAPESSGLAAGLGGRGTRASPFSEGAAAYGPVTPPRIIRAPMPVPALPHGNATEETLAYVIVQKYQFGLPLYRMEQGWLMEGVRISRQTMANWVIAATERWLAPVYARMRESLLGRDIIMADETTVQVLHEPGKAAASNSYMWLYRSGLDGPPAALFEYQPSRSGDNPARFLDGFEGFLATDGYMGYYKLKGVTNVSCWAHARRKFHDALLIIPAERRFKPSATLTGLEFCNALYEVERRLKGASPAERLRARELESRPILDKFKQWLERTQPLASPKSHLAVAVGYCLNYWGYLCNYLLDGRLEIDNSRSERSIKPFVVGRKGWLFSNTQKGARASAIAYSIVETAKENGLIPREYLVHVLKALPNAGPNDKGAIDGVLPWSDKIPDHCRSMTHETIEAGEAVIERAAV
jgi:transposase